MMIVEWDMLIFYPSYPQMCISEPALTSAVTLLQNVSVPQCWVFFITIGRLAQKDSAVLDILPESEQPRNCDANAVQSYAEW